MRDILQWPSSRLLTILLLNLTKSSHVLTLAKKIGGESNIQEQSPLMPRRNNESSRNKRFVTLTEFNQLVGLTKGSDIAEIIKQNVKIDENDEIQEGSMKKKNLKSRILFKLPENKNPKDLIQIDDENLKNNLLNYCELIIGENLIKIE